ncbi:MAG TPA: hypothetical protein VFE33_10675 [Thermoanaerobaculia bacterium]|nr:hypothetical protein [Thermoanaerobaculia bacterium]
MNCKRLAAWCLALGLATVLGTAGLAAQDTKLVIGGTTYTKWLWGNQRYDGSVYNFTTVPGEGFGDNGQGSEVELLLSARVSKQVEVHGRLHSRFNQNFWTNFGGFGGTNPALQSSPTPCIAGDCGENDPRSNQYLKLRGVAVTLTPGYKWIDSATIGANDFGQFDPFVIGRFRYIDRDNASGLLFQGSGASRRWTWDAVRISLPRLFAGPNFSTGPFHAADAAYGYQTKFTVSPKFDLGFILNYNNDIEIDATDNNFDNGRDIRTRFRDQVGGFKFGVHPNPKVDWTGQYYHSWSDSVKDLTPTSFFGLSGFSPVPAGKHDDSSWKTDLSLSDPFGVGLSFNFQVFDIGANYVALMASRREADVLLTEGHDATFAFPGPNNAKFGVFASGSTPNADGFNRSVIGYGGWDGNMQQIPTINVDNEFTDFDEPAAETVIGWKGFTVVPTWSLGGLDLSAEFTHVGYNTDWQAFDNPNQPVTATVYPVMELDTGVGHNFRSAYEPFQDKKTDLAVLKGKYTIAKGKGIDVFGKIKYIKEKDNRLNDARFLPYKAGDCPGGGTACAGNKNFYSTGNTTADIYGNPPVITVNGITGYQWKPFDSLSDDDRDLKYSMAQLGAGYQLTDDLYASLTYEYFHAKLQDGDTAFQAYNLHEMASGTHEKNVLSLKARYILAGAEIGFEYQYAYGTFDPDFGGGFVVQYADATIAKDHQVPVGSPGFTGRFGGWNSLDKRSFDQQRIKAFMKVQF